MLICVYLKAHMCLGAGRPLLGGGLTFRPVRVANPITDIGANSLATLTGSPGRAAHQKHREEEAWCTPLGPNPFLYPVWL